MGEENGRGLRERVGGGVKGHVDEDKEEEET